MKALLECLQMLCLEILNVDWTLIGRLGCCGVVHNLEKNSRNNLGVRVYASYGSTEIF